MGLDIDEVTHLERKAEAFWHICILVPTDPLPKTSYTDDKEGDGHRQIDNIRYRNCIFARPHVFAQFPHN